MRRLLLIAFFLEVGLVLTFAPWSAYWDRNYFVESFPLVDAVVTNNFIRGAVTGIGVVNLLAAASEVISLLLVRRVREPIVSIRPSAVEDQ